MRQVAVFPAAGGYPVTQQAQADLYDSIYHTHAVVGINTSVMVEAAIIGRSTLTVLDGTLAESQSGMMHFRHLQQPGAVKMARTLPEHFEQLGQILATNPSACPEARDFVRFFLRPQGLDRPSTPVLADAIQDLAAVQPKPFMLPWYAVLVRMTLALPACWLWIVNWRRTTLATTRLKGSKNSPKKSHRRN